MPALNALSPGASTRSTAGQGLPSLTPACRRPHAAAEPKRPSSVATIAALDSHVSTECCNTETSPDDTIGHHHPTPHPNPMPARLSPSRHLRIGRSKSGLGLFTRVPIKKGQFIIRYTGKKIPTKITDDLDT